MGLKSKDSISQSKMLHGNGVELVPLHSHAAMRHARFSLLLFHLVLQIYMFV